MAEPPALDPVLGMIAEHRWPEVRRAVRDWPVADLADLLERVHGTEAAVLFRALPRALSSDVFAHLEPEQQEEILESLTDHETTEILLALDPDDRTAFLEDLPDDVTRRLIAMLPHDEVEEAQELLGYPEESVGRLMTPDYVELRPDMTLAQALEHIRAHGHDSETISRLYVTDETDLLLGDVRLRLVILGKPSDRVESIMDRDCARLAAADDREEAVRLMQRADAFVLPVVDGEGRLVGIVTADDVFDVAEEEATEDIQISAGVAPLETTYRRADVGHLYTRRVGWLGGLVFVSLASSFVIAGFEDTLSASIGLAFFIPILMATGGNTGSQSSMLMVRALATQEVRLDEWARTFTKELGVGLLLGATLGIVAGGLGIVRSGMDIAIIVMLTMTLLVLVANVLGMSLPFLLERMGIDPAVASAPLITVLVDAIGLLIYFSLAAWML